MHIFVIPISDSVSYPHEQVNPKRGRLSEDYHRGRGDSHWNIYHVAKVKGKLRSKRSIGFPDLVLVRGGRLIFAELKVGKNNPTDDQMRWLTELRRAHHYVYLWRPCDWREIEEVLR